MTTTITISDEIMAAVRENDEKRKAQEICERAKVAASCIQSVVYKLEGLNESLVKMVNRNNAEVKLWVLTDRHNQATDYVAIFNISEINGREDLNSITMYVPNGTEKLVYGPGKTQLKELLNTPWLKKRHIKWLNVKTY